MEFRRKNELIFLLAAAFLSGCAHLRSPEVAAQKEERQKAHEKEFAEEFKWWPTDAKPLPFEDKEKGGWWWWPEVPGEQRPWGNRGYVYIRKIIFDEQGRPEILIKRIVRNVKVYFDYDKADVRDDAVPILTDAVKVMRKDPTLTILLTGNADRRGSEEYNLKLAEARADHVRAGFIARGVGPERIKILSRGKLDAVAPVTDLVGMQKDRNVQFMVAEIEEIQGPAGSQTTVSTGAPPEEKKIVEEVQNLESAVKVDVKEYIVQKNDSLWKIAEREYGNGNRWRFLYEYNKARIPNPQRLRPGTKIEIPIE